jgi:hypothetical protein
MRRRFSRTDNAGSRIAAGRLAVGYSTTVVESTIIVVASSAFSRS